MIARDKKWDALLSTLDGTHVNHAARDEAAKILCAHLKRTSRDEFRPVIVARRDSRQLMLCGYGFKHNGDGYANPFIEGVYLGSQDTPTIRDQFCDHTDGSIVIAADGNFKWTWAEVATGLAAALRAVPATRRPREVLCDHCNKQFFR